MVKCSQLSVEVVDNTQPLFDWILEEPYLRATLWWAIVINWKSEYIALLSRYYREKILKVATTEGYLKANAVIGRAAHVRGSTVGRWIEGIGRPNAVQGERLLRWAARVGWWEWDEDRAGTTFPWKQVTIADKLHELIQESKRGG